MRRVFFCALLAFFASVNLSAEAVACSVHARHRHNVVTCPQPSDTPCCGMTLAKANLEGQKIIHEAKRIADSITISASSEAENTIATAQRDADTIRAKATQEADGIKVGAQRDADSSKTKAAQDADGIKVVAQRDADAIKAKAAQDADNIKESAQREKRDAETLMAGAVATQKSAAEQIDQANRSKLEFDKQTQELKDKIKETEDARRKAAEAQTVFEGATSNLDAERKELVSRFESILRTVGLDKGSTSCCRTKERCC